MLLTFRLLVEYFPVYWYYEFRHVNIYHDIKTKGMNESASVR